MTCCIAILACCQCGCLCVAHGNSPTHPLPPPLRPLFHFTGKTFVVSGVLDSMKREEAEDYVKRHGGKVGTRQAVWMDAELTAGCRWHAMAPWCAAARVTYSSHRSPLHHASCAGDGQRERAHNVPAGGALRGAHQVLHGQGAPDCAVTIVLAYELLRSPQRGSACTAKRRPVFGAVVGTWPYGCMPATDKGSLPSLMAVPSSPRPCYLTRPAAPPCCCCLLAQDKNVQLIDEDGLFSLVAAAPAPKGMETEEAPAPEDSWDAVSICAARFVGCLECGSRGAHEQVAAPEGLWHATHAGATLCGVGLFVWACRPVQQQQVAVLSALLCGWAHHSSATTQLLPVSPSHRTSSRHMTATPFCMCRRPSRQQMQWSGSRRQARCSRA